MSDIKYLICSRCIMDTSDPEIAFDPKGVCNHCLRFDNEIKPNWFPNDEGKVKLDNIIAAITQSKKKRDYDCVIGLSGGVDSTYLAYHLRTTYPELKILAIHIDGGWNSELAVHNIEQIVKKLDIDLYTGVVNWEEMKDLQLAYFKSQLANQDVPQDHVFFAKLYEVSLKHNIKYFLTGGNFATESILPPAWGYNAMDAVQLRAVHKKFGKLKLKDYTTVSFFKKYFYYPFVIKFKIIRPLDLIEYNKDDAKRVITEKLDWRDYGGKHHESRFTKFFQAHWLPKKFGFDKRRCHLASLILAGQISRQDALIEMLKPLYNLQELEDDKEYLAKKLGLSLVAFDQIMSMPNKTFVDYPSELKFEKFMRKIYRVFKPL